MYVNATKMTFLHGLAIMFFICFSVVYIYKPVKTSSKNMTARQYKPIL